MLRFARVCPLTRPATLLSTPSRSVFTLSPFRLSPSPHSSTSRPIQPWPISPQLPGRSLHRFRLQTSRSYTRVTRRTNIIHIRRRKMNIHKYKKRRRLLKNSTRHSMSKKKKSRPAMLKERKEIAVLMEYFKVCKMI